MFRKKRIKEANKALKKLRREQNINKDVLDYLNKQEERVKNAVSLSDAEKDEQLRLMSMCKKNTKYSINDIEDRIRLAEGVLR